MLSIKLSMLNNSKITVFWRNMYSNFRLSPLFAIWNSFRLDLRLIRIIWARSTFLVSFCYSMNRSLEKIEDSVIQKWKMYYIKFYTSNAILDYSWRNMAEVGNTKTKYAVENTKQINEMNPARMETCMEERLGFQKEWSSFVSYARVTVTKDLIAVRYSVE